MSTGLLVNCRVSSRPSPQVMIFSVRSLALTPVRSALQAGCQWVLVEARKQEAIAGLGLECHETGRVIRYNRDARFVTLY
ncbi:jg618 [Pararge aegeria aegeria]|uniref:Jg618 protein n=1 Tax=Pararge aegeria aegeria TaxID=348720 RepID=A0A8S4QQN7_9NEOP|nr:jg618 [Pararge aegeria aegeria]